MQATLVADAHVSASQPTVNAGRLSNLNVGNGYAALIQFDLGVLPAGTNSAQITRATLRIFCNRADVDGAVTVQRLTGAWTESGVTFATMPGLGASAGAANVSVPGQFVTFDVTSMVQGWVAIPASNFGLALSSTAATVQFDSKENDETSHLPQLEIVLTAGTTGAGAGSSAVGATGGTGATGAVGSQGVQGLNGAPGPQGATGAVGATGAAGAAGAGLVNYQGGYDSTQNYANGDVVTFAGSTYISQVSSNHGNTPGFGSGWGLLAAVGATGTTGTAGPSGSTGQQGAPGFGIQGVTGATGAMGSTGLTGTAGLVYQGAYNSINNYNMGDVVIWDGSSFVSLVAFNHGNTPGLVPGTWGALTAQGPAGFTGATGITGISGPTGSLGPVGPPGERGDQGQQGIAGQAGAQGIPGTVGSTGLQGPMGPIGAAGPVGMSFQGSYSSGTNYSVGQGVLWQGAGWVSLVNSNHGNAPDASPSVWAIFAAPGVTGAVGATGASLAGATGAVGATGATGVSGLTGATGAAGVAGLVFQGNYNSATSYNVADAVSYDGSSYVSLVGNNHGQAPGTSPNWAVLAAQGNVGASGATGMTGSTGSAGAGGVTGATGAQGAPVQFRGEWSNSTAYSPGDAVSYGGAGYIALSSNTGREPDSGPLYWGLLVASGSTGATGAVGATGFEGPLGYPGATGQQGSTGAQGAQGVAGALGPAGAVGPAGPAGPVGGTGATGLVFQGTYSPAINYSLGNAVSYNGSSYISVASSNVGQTPGGAPAYWQLLAQAGSAGAAGAQGGMGPQGLQGSQGTAGNAGATGATGAAGAAGINFRGAWTTASNYAANDAVAYGGSSYIALVANRNSEPDLNPGSWSVLAQAGGSGAAGSGSSGAVGATGATGATGLTFQGTYSPATSYGLAAGVTYNGSSYISVVSGNQGQTPGSAPSFWQLLAQSGSAGATGAQGVVGPQGLQGQQGAVGGVGSTGATGAAGAAGLNFRNAWTAASNYAINDGVTFGGSSYIALAANRNQEPDLYPGSWSVLAQAGGSGAAGANGATGSVASVTVGTITTLAAGSQATVTNSGTSSAAILNFGLPQGAAGAAGSGGGTGSSGNPMVMAVYHPVGYTTSFYSINTPNASATETAAVLAYVPRHCTAARLDVYSQQSALITVTLRAGTSGSMTGTTLSCSASSNSSCFATGVTTITAGEFLDLQITGASGTTAGVFTAVECDLLP